MFQSELKYLKDLSICLLFPPVLDSAIPQFDPRLRHDFYKYKQDTNKNANARTSHCMQKGGLGAG